MWSTTIPPPALGGPGGDVLHGGFGPGILSGGDGNDTIIARSGDDELYGQAGNDTLNGGDGNDKGFGGDGNDTLILGKGNNEADGGAGADTVNSGTGTDLVLGGGGDDVLNAGAGADELTGNAGDDTLNGGAGNDVLLGGPGRDIVNAGGGNDTVLVYDACELTSGEALNGEGGADTLQIPMTLAEVQALGVVVTGFETIVVEDGLAHLSDCHCFHGDVDQITDEGVTCTCDPGWGGDRCDECADLTVCLPNEQLAATVEALLAAAPPGTGDHPGAVARTIEFAIPMLLADTTIVAGVKSTTEFKRATMTPTFFETFTRAELLATEVIRGANVSLVDITFNGPASHEADGFGSESPYLAGGNRRLYGVRLAANNGSHLVEGAADWRVDSNDELDLGFYRISLDAVRVALNVTP